MEVEQESLIYGTLRSKRNKAIIAIAAVIFVLILTGVIIVVSETVRNHDESIPTDPLQRAEYLHAKAPLTDGHNDLPWVYRMATNNNISLLDISKPQPQQHTDIPRLRFSNVGAQFWSVYVPCQWTPWAVQATMEQIDVTHQFILKYSDTFQLAETSDQIDSAFKAKKIASLMGMEGGHSINSSLGVLRMFYKLGARYMTLTHTCSTPWAQSANDVSGDVVGLTAFGKEVVLEMNRIGMMVDISHVAVQTMHDVLDTVRAPIIFSHSGARNVCDHIRNAPDDVLKRLPANGGIVMVVFYPGFVCERFRLEYNNVTSTPGCDSSCVSAALTAFQANPETRCNVSDVADHIDHIKNVAGIDHIGLGADYDGVDFTPYELEDVGKYLNLTMVLIERGYTNDEILKITSKNLQRVLQQVEQASEQI